MKDSQSDAFDRSPKPDSEEAPLIVERSPQSHPFNPPHASSSQGQPLPPPPSAGDSAATDEEESELGGKMTFLEHLDELRKRILNSLLSLVVTFAAAWIFREEIFRFLAFPIRDVVEELVVVKPTEPFTIYLKVSFAAGLFLAAPFILFQVWKFIAPGLYRREKMYALPFVVCSTLLFILGGMFAYYVILPPALDFLLNEFGADFRKMITAVEYFDFEILILVGMGLIFQLPVLVAFLSIFGMITPRFLWKNFRYAFLLIVLVAAVLSPTTDPFNLLLWSVPMVVLYLISIGISWVFKRRRSQAARG